MKICGSQNFVLAGRSKGRGSPFTVYRIGSGYDLHCLAAGRRLKLGGVEIPKEKGLAGHSDADALLHAITDALLGAAALGNIGQLFPDSDPSYKDADSRTLLKEAFDRVSLGGYEIVNIDATVIAQAPKLNPHVQAMRASISEILDVPIDSVSIKPKTNEGVGPEGRGEAISVHASVLLRKTGA